MDKKAHKYLLDVQKLVEKAHKSHQEDLREIRSRFGKYLRKERERRAVTLRSLAAALEVAPSFLSDVENGRKSMTLVMSKTAIDYLRTLDTDKPNA